MEERVRRMGAGRGKWGRGCKRLGTRLFIYRYSLARGVGRWAWHVVVALPYGNCGGCWGRVWAIAAVTRGYGCGRRCEGWERGYLYIGILG